MKVFLSYSNRDETIAARIRNHLTHNNVDISFIIPEIGDSFDIKSGLYDAINQADAILFLISKNSQQSQWMSQEISLATHNRAQGKNVRLIPLLLDKDIEIPFFLKGYIYLDISDYENFNDAMRHLTNDLKVSPSTTLSEDLSERARKIEYQSIYLKALEFEHQQYKKFQNRQIALFVMVVTILSATLASVGLLGWLAKIDITQTQLIIFLLIGTFTSTLGSLFYLRKSKSGHDDFINKIEEIKKEIMQMEFRNDK